MHVVEAVLIGLVMVSAVSFVVTYSAPTNTTQPTRQRLDAQALDAVKVLDEFPANDARYGNNTLSKFVFQCLQAKCSDLTSRLDGLLPEATSYNVYVNNGYAYLPVYEPKLPAGESVNVRHPIEPRLTYVWMQTSTEEVAPSLKTTLGVFALPVYNSNILLDGGSGVEVRVQGYNNNNLRTFNLTAFYSTQEGPSGSDLASPTIVAKRPDGTPALFLDRLSDSTNKSLFLEVKETAGKVLRKGTTINVTAPRGFALDMYSSGTYTTWWNAATTTGSSVSGMSLTASLKQDTPAGAALQFRLNATPVTAPPVGPDSFDFYSFNVRLGNGAYSVADLILKYRQSATATGGDFHAVAASIPKPMGSTGSARYGIAVQSPILPNPSESITITRVEFLQPEGYKIFQGTPTAVGGVYGGTWRVGDGSGSAGSTLGWSGVKAMIPGEAFDMFVDVNGAGTLTPAVPREHQTAGIRTPSSNTAFTREVGPGLFYGEIPRDERVTGGTLTGYFWPPVGGQVDVALVSDVRPVSHRETVIPGGWNYDVTTLATLRDSLSLINITLSQRVVPIGDKVTIDVDAQNLLLNLSEKGIDAKTRIKLYPSWALDTHTTIRDNSTTERSIFDSATTHVLLYDFTADGTKDVLVATDDGGVYVLNGKNGYKVPGLSAKLANGKVTSMSVGYLEVTDTAKAHPYVLIGTDASGTGINLYLLDMKLDEKWASRVSAAGAGGQKVVSLDVVPDVDGEPDANGNYWHDVAVGDIAGSWYYVRGQSGTTIRTGAAIGTPPATGALVSGGVWGLGKADGIVTTTGVTVNVIGDTTLSESTLGGVTEAVKHASLNLYSGGVLALNKTLSTIWTFGSPVDLYETIDLDGDGVTDVVAANSAGTVSVLNGTQAALPFNGVTYATGSKIVDGATLPGDPYHLWSINNDGMVMYSTDGMTTRWYASDVPTAGIGGAFYSVPGARAIHMANADAGWIVGDTGKVWKTLNGSSETGPGVFSSVAVSVAGRSDNALWNLKDVWALGPDNVVMVGECATTCAGAVAFRYTTTMGWTTMPTFGATDKLSRVHFYDANRGWVTSSATATTGKVYRTLDGGVTWLAPVVELPGKLNGIAFRDSLNGFVVGDGGFIRQTQDGGVSWSVPTSLGTTEKLNDISFSDSQNGVIVGNTGVVFRTYDGGVTWVRITGDATLDYTRAPFPHATQGYILGGPVATAGRYVGMMATYSSYSVATSGFTLSPGGNAEWITITPTTRNMDGYTNVKYWVSANGGSTWREATKMGSQTDVLENVNYHPVYVGDVTGTNVKIKMEIFADSAFPHVSAEVENVKAEVSYRVGANNLTSFLVAKFPVEGAVDPGSTAVWDAAAGGVRSPRIRTFWNQQLPAGVLALDTGRKLTTASHNDGQTDVLAATASNDRSVYALSGSNGAILWKSPILGASGSIRAVAFADLPTRTGDAFVDAVAVLETTTADPVNCPGATTISYVYALNGYTGAVVGSPFRLCTSWKGFGAADLSGDAQTDVVIGQVGNIASSPGYVYAIDGKTGGKLWRTVPSIKGLYTLEYEAPRNSIFGPYIVEVEVSGTQTLGGVSVSLVTRSITYFLVTPPDRQMPMSPIYTVELVVWYDDWDFAPGATNVEVLPPLPTNPSWPINIAPGMREYNIR